MADTPKPPAPPDADADPRADADAPAAAAPDDADAPGPEDDPVPEDDAADAQLGAMLSTLRGARVAAPESFTDEVAQTIHRRSAGKFFGKRTLGDRVPFGVLLVIALAILITTSAVLWTSQTGTLRLRDGAQRPALAPGAEDVLPRP